jgi:hypothetical protein
MGMCDRGGCSSTEFADNALAFKTKLAALFMPRVKNPATFKFQKKRSSLPRIKKPFSVDPVTRHAKL